MEIPTTSYIEAAKKKRDTARKAGGEIVEDFISLSVTKRADQDLGPHPESRLMREEDVLGEADDGMLLSSRLAWLVLIFGQNSLNIPARRNVSHSARKQEN